MVFASRRILCAAVLNTCEQASLLSWPVCHQVGCVAAFKVSDNLLTAMNWSLFTRSGRLTHEGLSSFAKDLDAAEDSGLGLGVSS